MSTRAGGAAPPVIRITAQAIVSAGDASLRLTVREEAARRWRYTLSAQGNSIAYGTIITPDHMAALRGAAQICANGFPPDSTERGLLDALARDTP